MVYRINFIIILIFDIFYLRIILGLCYFDIYNTGSRSAKMRQGSKTGGPYGRAFAA